MIGILRFRMIYTFYVCHFNYTTYVGNRKVRTLITRLIRQVGWLLSLQRTAPKWPEIVVQWNVNLASFEIRTSLGTSVFAWLLCRFGLFLVRLHHISCLSFNDIALISYILFHILQFELLPCRAGITVSLKNSELFSASQTNKTMLLDLP